MTSSPSVTLRFNKADKAALVELAKCLQKNQTETLRVLVREKLAAIKRRQEGAGAREAIDSTGDHYDNEKAN